MTTGAGSGAGAGAGAAVSTGAAATGAGAAAGAGAATGAAVGFAAGAGAGVAGAGVGAAMTPGAAGGAAAGSTGAGTTVVVSMPGIASTIVPEVILVGSATVASTAPGTVDAVAVGSTGVVAAAPAGGGAAAKVGSSGRLADAITAVRAKMPEAVSPLTAMRAPAATWPRRRSRASAARAAAAFVRLVGAGACAWATMTVGAVWAMTTCGGAGGVVGAAQDTCTVGWATGAGEVLLGAIGFWPRLARIWAMRSSRLSSVIVARFLVLILVLAVVVLVLVFVFVLVFVLAAARR